MTANIGLGDVVRLLAYRDHFRDFGMALAMIGITSDSRFIEALTDLATPVPDPSDEDERVYSEPVDGWVPSRSEKWAAGSRDETGVGSGISNNPIVEKVETYGCDWQSSRPQPSRSANDRSESADHAHRRMRDTRQTARFVIAHVLAPTSDEKRTTTPFTYRSVPRRRRYQTHSEQALRRDEVAWRLAVECLSATNVETKRQSIDIAACVDALARCQAIERLPMREHGTRRLVGHTLLRDISLSNGPLGGDITAFIASIQANSRHTVDILGFSQTIEVLGCGKGPIWSWRPLDMSTMGQHVIVVSNLSSDAQRQHMAWCRVAQSLTTAGRHIAFVNVGETATMTNSDWPGQWFNLVL